tara:strand:- start:373 stop:1278 length:906 start_codon:yes stop_codon:yes gene_type:complete
MRNICKLILRYGRSFETDPYCSSVKDIFSMVGSDEIRVKDAEEFRSPLKVIIPAAGANPALSSEVPCSMLSLGEKSILGHQISVLNDVGLTNVSVIRGFGKEQMNINGLKYYDNDNYLGTSMLASLMLAGDEMNDGFIAAYSDVIFDKEVIQRLAEAKGDIVIVADNSYRFHQHEVEKSLALIRTDKKSHVRELGGGAKNKVLSVGTKMSKELAQFEFIGLAKFSKEGAEHLKRVYEDCKNRVSGGFHEAESFEKAKVTDMLQEMIDRGFKVSFIEVHKGWMEIHTPEDYEQAKSFVSGGM